MWLALLFTAIALLVVIVVIQLLLLSRLNRRDDPQLTATMTRLETQTQALSSALDRVERSLRDELAIDRSTGARTAQENRAELTRSVAGYQDALLKRLSETSGMQRGQLDSFAQQLLKLTESNERRLQELRATIDQRLTQLQTENAAKLEQMRATVDEKLQSTLERRLTESFKLVTGQLEIVQRGLGEMQSLAANVGDLKKVLANVKVRGGWGEVQLGALLDQLLTPEQYDTNVVTRPGSSERVEFAIRLPGHDEHRETIVLLPIDAKFPLEDYQRLVAASEAGDVEAIDRSGKDLEARIKSCAKDIHNKYLNPPDTTDFALLFLPIEGLYAEVLRRPGLAEQLQREYRVVITGPTTLAAILNALQMGFRTLAIEKRSSEVWRILGAVRTEFGKFGETLGKVQKKLQEASNQIESAETRHRVIQRKLRGVESLPEPETRALLGAETVEPEEELPSDESA